MIGNISSSCAPLSCGVPQGSILDPLLLTVYMLPLEQILHRNGLDFYCYADDKPLYVLFKPGTTDVSHILSCQTEVSNWISDHFLLLNDLER